MSTPPPAPSDTIGLPADPPGEAVAPRRIGDFAVVRVLGEGGMGTVYLAEDARLGRKAAIKTMRPELAAKPENRARFAREARAAAAVEHDNIVPVWQVGEAADGSPFIAMPFLQGETLDARLKREAVSPPALVLKVAREVAEGLAAAHAYGLVHRDVKPGNVWLEGDPSSPDLDRQVRRCKVLDFGLARSVAGGDAQITASGVILGTPAYMALEQAMGGEVDHRADLFSLGVILYRMATGRPPFAGSNAMAVLAALATATPAPARSLNPGLPPALADLIGRLLSKDPAGRPQSAAEVAAAARRIATESQAWEPAPGPAAMGADDTLAVEAPPPRAKAGRRRTPWLVALGLLALAPLAWWVTAVLLRGGPGDGGRVVEVDPDREAAEWVLSIGGIVRVGAQEREVKAVADLPRGPFRLTVADLRNNKQVSDEGLAAFKGCKDLLDLGLSGTRVGDAGLAHFAGCKSLRTLGLEGTQVGDAGLAHFKGCKSLTGLLLSGTRVSDAGLEPFKDCKNLTYLSLGGTKVGDAGLAHFKDCKDLTILHLEGTSVGDAGLAHLAGRKELIALNLSGTRVGGAGLAHFKGCKNLQFLGLSGTQVGDADLAPFKDSKNLRDLWLEDMPVGDAGLAHFEGCKNLTGLKLRKTKVTAGKIDELKKALPGCKIEWDGGTIEPAADPDRKAAEWVLSVGGAVYVDGQGGAIKAAADLPRGPFRLTAVELGGNKQVTEAGLAHFQGCRSLAGLDLSYTGVTDAGLAHFKGCEGLRYLWLGGTKVGDVGLAHFKGCKSLTGLGLEGTGVTDEGLAHFKGCAGLTHLNLNGAKVGDAGLAAFKGCKHLQYLGLGGTQVSDEGLAYFKGCKGLTQLRLYGTRVGDAGLAHFAGCADLADVHLAHTGVGDAGLAHLKGCKRLTNLDLDFTPVGDAGVAHLTGCEDLKRLNLRQTKVTAAKVEELRKALPACKIEWDGK